MPAARERLRRSAGSRKPLRAALSESEGSSGRWPDRVPKRTASVVYGHIILPCRRRPLYPVADHPSFPGHLGRSLREVSWVNPCVPRRPPPRFFLRRTTPCLKPTIHRPHPFPIRPRRPRARSPPASPGMPPDGAVGGAAFRPYLDDGPRRWIARGAGRIRLRGVCPLALCPLERASAGDQGRPDPRSPRTCAADTRVSQDRTATSSYGVLGAFLGLALGAAGGLSRRSPRAAITAALIGPAPGRSGGRRDDVPDPPLVPRLLRPAESRQREPAAGPCPGDARRHLDGRRRRGGAGPRIGPGRRAGRAGHRRRDPGRRGRGGHLRVRRERSYSRWTGPICPRRWHRRRGCSPTSPWRSACRPGRSGPPMT